MSKRKVDEDLDHFERLYKRQHELRTAERYFIVRSKIEEDSQCRKFFILTNHFFKLTLYVSPTLGNRIKHFDKRQASAEERCRSVTVC